MFVYAITPAIDSGRGGGVTFLSETYKVEIIRTPEYFEVMCILIKLSSISTNFICIYRPLASTNTLFDEFPGFLESTFQFQEHLYMFIEFLTHVHGYWFDLFITYTNIKAIFPTDGLSDHHYVIIDLSLRSINLCNMCHFLYVLVCITTLPGGASCPRKQSLLSHNSLPSSATCMHNTFVQQRP